MQRRETQDRWPDLFVRCGARVLRFVALATNVSINVEKGFWFTKDIMQSIRLPVTPKFMVCCESPQTISEKCGNRGGNASEMY